MRLIEAWSWRLSLVSCCIAPIPPDVVMTDGKIAGLHLPIDKALHRLPDIRDVVGGKSQIVGHQDYRALNLLRPQRLGRSGNRFERFTRKVISEEDPPAPRRLDAQYRRHTRSV